MPSLRIGNDAVDRGRGELDDGGGLCAHAMCELPGRERVRLRIWIREGRSNSSLYGASSCLIFLLMWCLIVQGESSGPMNVSTPGRGTVTVISHRDSIRYSTVV